MGLRDSVLVKDPHFTLAHHGVSSSSVVRATDLITEDRGFKSHPELDYFSHYANTYYDVISNKDLLWKPGVRILKPRKFWSEQIYPPQILIITSFLVLRNKRTRTPTKVG